MEAIIAAISGLILLVVGAAINRFWPSKKDAAEARRNLLEGEKAAKETAKFVNAMVEERDHNLSLKLKSLQQELISASDANYKLHKESNLLKMEMEDRLLAFSKKLNASLKHNEDCEQELFTLKKELEKKQDKV